MFRWFAACMVFGVSLLIMPLAGMLLFPLPFVSFLLLAMSLTFWLAGCHLTSSEYAI